MSITLLPTVRIIHKDAADDTDITVINESDFDPNGKHADFVVVGATVPSEQDQSNANFGGKKDDADSKSGVAVDTVVSVETPEGVVSVTVTKIDGETFEGKIDGKGKAKSFAVAQIVVPPPVEG